MPDIDRDRFATVSQMVKLFGNKVSSDAIRRYIKKYEGFFNSTFVRGVQFIETEPGLKVIGVIHGAIRAGRNRGGNDVLDALKIAGIEPIPVKPEPSLLLPVAGVNDKCKEVVVRLCDEDRALLKDILQSKMIGGCEK